MAARNQTYEELLDQIQLSLQRMIDVLKTPPLASAHEPPSPASAPTTPPPALKTVPPTASVAAPSPNQSVLRAPFPAPYGPKSAPPQTASYTPTPKATTITPKPISSSSQVVSKPIQLFSPRPYTRLVQVDCINRRLTSRSNCFNLVSEDEANNVTAGKREWHPPWRLPMTSPDSVGRTEWRPPWNIVTTRSFKVSAFGFVIFPALVLVNLFNP